MTTDYAEVMRLWEVVGLAEGDHECVDQEFFVCDVCQASHQAWADLEHRTRDLLELLESHHAALDEVVRTVRSDVPMPRTMMLEAALSRAEAVLSEGP
jgi:hypothetical protein